MNLTALPPLHQPRPGTFHDSVCIGGAMNAAHAASEHGVDRYIEMSSLGGDLNSPIAYWRTQGIGDMVVQYLDLDWTVLRPSFIFGEGRETFAFIERYTTPYVTVLPDGGTYPTFQPSGSRIWSESPQPRSRTTNTSERRTNSVARRYWAFAEVTRMLYRARGKPVIIVPVPMRLAKVGMYVIDPLPSIPFGIDQARALDMSNVTEHNDIDAFGLDASDLLTVSEYFELDRGRQRRANRATP